MSQNNSTKPSQPGQQAGKVKKALFLGVAASGAFSALLIPVLASASFFDALVQRSAAQSSAADSSFNSQTVPLLAAAINIDPSPSNQINLTVASGDALVSVENPLASSDIVSRPVNSQISVYVVRDGDTLASIATMFGVSPNTIVGANDIKGGVIKPGRELIILPITGIQHTVLKGETLASLAKTYKSDAGDIATYNNLDDSGPLSVGQTIIIPNGELVSTASQGSSANTTTSQTKAKTTTTKTKSTASKSFKSAPLRDAGGPEYDNYYQWPVAGGIITQTLHGYNGIDIGAPTGTDMYASAAGTVIIAKNNNGWNGGYGNYIVIAHPNGTQTLYGHASKVFVSAGDTVTQGELIGKVGRTGEATGPHLHFEVRGATNPFGAIPVGSGE